MSKNGLHDQDPLLLLFMRFKEALWPLGVYVDPLVYRMWTEAAARGDGLFTPSGEFREDVVAGLAELLGELSANTADSPEAARPHVDETAT